jgi:hypothetical protein
MYKYVYTKVHAKLCFIEFLHQHLEQLKICKLMYSNSRFENVISMHNEDRGTFDKWSNHCNPPL